MTKAEIKLNLDLAELDATLGPVKALNLKLGEVQQFITEITKLPLAELASQLRQFNYQMTDLGQVIEKQQYMIERLKKRVKELEDNKMT